MSFNALNLNKTADISSAFLGSVIDDVISGKPDLRKFSAGPDIEAMDLALNRVEQLEHARRLLSPAGGSEATEDYRLVKRCKSPTRSEKEISRRLELQKQEFGLNEKELAKRHADYLELHKDKVKLPYQKSWESKHDPVYAPNSGGLNVVLDQETGELKLKVGQRPAKATLSHREWSGDYRFRVSVQASNSEPPPAQSGDRITTMLNSRAASKILDSGAFVSAVRDGYTTFLTPTFDNAARYRLANDHYYKIGMGKAGDEISPDVKATGRYTKVELGKSTIGREVSRFFDAANRMYQRGWQVNNQVLRTRVIHSPVGPIKMNCIGMVAKIARAPLIVEAVQVIHSKHGPIKMECVSTPEKLDYLWVAECPVTTKVIHSDKGPIKHVKQNPHCHVLMRWNVEPYLFYDWAKRLEGLWGNGIAKLERIKNANAASGYLLKAIGYVLKGSANDQGEIRGNRYNISKPARAPGYECMAEFDAQNMMAIIKEMKEKVRLKDAPVRAKIIHAQSELAESQRVYNINKAIKGRTRALRTITLEKIRKKMDKFRVQIDEGYQKIKSRGVRISDWQITFNDSESLGKFMGYASAKRGWGAKLITDGINRNEINLPPSPDLDYLQKPLDELISKARRYWGGLAAKLEVREVCWPLQMADANLEREYEGVTTDEYYNEYYNYQDYLVV